MSIAEIILLSLALSIDSLAVAFSGSVSMGRPDWKKVAEVSISLALVQTGFFVGGYFAGDAVSALIRDYGGYVGFAILLYLGINMIHEGWKGADGESKDFSSLWRILAAGVATSIDAVAVGASFGLTGIGSGDFRLTAAFTFAATVALAIIGMCCGSGMGRKWNRTSKIIAGLVLIAIGVRIVLA